VREASHEPNRPQRSHGAWPACARVFASISACRKVRGTRLANCQSRVLSSIKGAKHS